jgi:error-prone DNA polymerase
MIFQEQVIRVAQAIAGFSPGEADQLRRAMSRSRSEEAMTALGERFLTGAQENGVDGKTAAEVFRQLTAFSGYGFCKSHAAAFALVAYQTLYLKAYHPAAFYCALFNHQPMGFYSPDVLVGDARRHGVPILHPDVNRSQAACTLETTHAGLSIRLGLRYVHRLGETWQARIVDRRKARPFQDLRDLCWRTHLPRTLIENLIRSGAVDSFGHERRALLWELGTLVYHQDSLDLDIPVSPADLPALDRLGHLLWEYELLGLAPDDHVMGIYRERLRGQGVLSSGELATCQDGETVRVVGVVVVRQRPPSAKGMVFFTLEDEEGLVNLIVHPDVYEQYRNVLRNAPLLVAGGRFQRAGRATSIVVHQAAALVP